MRTKTRRGFAAVDRRSPTRNGSGGARDLEDHDDLPVWRLGRPLVAWHGDNDCDAPVRAVGKPRNGARRSGHAVVDNQEGGSDLSESDGDDGCDLPVRAMVSKPRSGANQTRRAVVDEEEGGSDLSDTEVHTASTRRSKEGVHAADGSERRTCAIFCTTCAAVCGCALTFAGLWLLVTAADTQNDPLVDAVATHSSSGATLAALPQQSSPSVQSPWPAIMSSLASPPPLPRPPSPEPPPHAPQPRPQKPPPSPEPPSLHEPAASPPPPSSPSSSPSLPPAPTPLPPGSPSPQPSPTAPAPAPPADPEAKPLAALPDVEDATTAAGPAYTVSWTTEQGFNCWPGHGAQDIDPPGKPVDGATTLALCKAACEAAATCEGVVTLRSSGACFRKTALNLRACAQDGARAVADTHVLLRSYPQPPPAPPSPPSPPSPPPFDAMDVVDQLNVRFHRGRPSNSLDEAGCIIHQFDSRDDPNPDGVPWIHRRDGMSAAVINGHQTPEADRQNIPIYSYSLAGFVLDPKHVQVRCSYAFDTGSLQWSNSCNGWRCSDTEDTDTHAWHGCAFNPTGLQRMMEVQNELRNRGTKPQFKVFDDHKFYNELILDSVAEDELPQAIAAVFYLPTPCDDIYDGPKCEAYARGAHRNILRHFRLTEAQLPLVKFDFFGWERPFVQMANCDIRATGVGSCGPAANAVPLDASYRLGGK